MCPIRAPFATDGAPAKRVLIADPDDCARPGLRAALEQGGFMICAEAVDTTSAIEAASRELPDACLIDIGLSGDGLVAAAEIDARLQSASIMMLTDRAEPAELLRALRAGAVGYIWKGMDAARLPHAVASMLAGEAAIPRLLVSRIIDELRGRTRAVAVDGGRAVELTRREWQILEQMRDGATTAEMAHVLGISAVTVRRHISGLLRKLGVSQRADAVRIAERT
jgi:DNA-binding NarL/FixJ family response regulator